MHNLQRHLPKRMLDDGCVDGPGEIGFLVPDDTAYMLAMQEGCERLGLPLAGAPEEAARRDLTGELLSLLLVLLSVPAPRTALTSLYISPLMPWTRDVGHQMAP